MQNPLDQLGSGAVRDSMTLAAAHELKSPLALIRQLALYGEEEDNRGEVDQILRRIQLTSERALRLTSSLTRSARLDEGLFSLEPINPMVVCEDVVREMRPIYDARGLEISAERRKAPLLGLANIELLRRILLNFTDNALNYSSSKQPVVIKTTLCQSTNKIRLSVRDFGPKLPADVWRELGGRVGHSAQPLHSRPESSGIGIVISRMFAEAMEAEVGAIRHRDGSTFYVDIMRSSQLRLL